MFEVWIFSGLPEYRSSGGIVKIETCPPEYGPADAELYARKLRATYATEGLDVNTVVRREASY
jgi:hypothetical protein